MENKHFELNILAYSIPVFTWILLIWAIGFLIGDSLTQINFVRNGIGLILIFGSLLSPAFMVTWAFIVERSTSFSANGISRLTVFGRKTMKWNEAKSLGRSIDYLLVIEFLNGKCRIPLLLYKNPNEIVDYVLSHINNVHSSK